MHSFCPLDVFLVFVLLAGMGCQGRDRNLHCYKCGDAPISWNCSENLYNGTHFLYTCVIPPNILENCTVTSIARQPELIGGLVEICSARSIFKNVSNGTDSFIVEPATKYGSDSKLKVYKVDQCSVQFESAIEWQTKQSESEYVECHCIEDLCNDRISILIRYKDAPTVPPTDSHNSSNVSSTNPTVLHPVDSFSTGAGIAAIILGVVMLVLLVATVLLGLLLPIRLRQRKKRLQNLMPDQKECIESTNETTCTHSDGDVESMEE